MPDFSLRPDHRDPAPVPHPQVGGDVPTDADLEQAGRDRVGDYVRRALTRELERRGVPWPVQVSWSEHALHAWLSRGELMLPARERRRRWWAPVNRHTGDQLVEGLAYVLERWWTMYQSADTTGRMRIPLWRTKEGALRGEAERGAERVTAVLEPGVRPGAISGGALALLYHVEDHRGRTMEEALTEGWVRLEGR